MMINPKHIIIFILLVVLSFTGWGFIHGNLKWSEPSRCLSSQTWTDPQVWYTKWQWWRIQFRTSDSRYGCPSDFDIDSTTGNVVPKVDKVQQ